MTEIDSVVSAVIDTLGSKKLRSVGAFPKSDFVRYKSPVIAVGVKAATGLSAGFGEYMGERTDKGVSIETYGKRMELDIGMDIYSPQEEYGAKGCVDTLSGIVGALAEMPTGIKVRELVCGDVKFDTKTDMFLQECTLKCICFLYAERSDDTELLNFSLRGVVNI
jgi:hypothetical protein